LNFGETHVTPVPGMDTPFGSIRNYDLSLDDKQLVVVLNTAAPAVGGKRPTLNVVVNWARQLAERK
jgi:hypothetical protein